MVFPKKLDYLDALDTLFGEAGMPDISRSPATPRFAAVILMALDANGGPSPLVRVNERTGFRI
jgi:hypothetical protein